MNNKIKEKVNKFKLQLEELRFKVFATKGIKFI